VIDAYLGGKLMATQEQPTEPKSDDSPHSLQKEELAVVALLKEALTQVEE
jgi:hypothetical protein